MLFLLPSFVNGNKTGDKKPGKKACLNISGSVESADKSGAKEITIQLIEENQVIDSIKVSQREEFGFLLERNKHFAIKVIRPGFQPRLISISTMMPDSMNEERVYRFHFDLLQQPEENVNKVQEDLIDFPVAVICYDKGKGYFDYNDHYTNVIKEAYKKAKHLQTLTEN